MFYVTYPKPMEILGHFENFGQFWKFLDCNFQSRRQIMTAREVYELGRHYMRMNLRMRITSIVKPSSFVCPNLDIYSSFCKECILREILNQSLLCSMLGVGGVRVSPPGNAEVSTSSKVLACSFLYSINAHYMQLFLYKRTHRNEREGLLDIVRHRLDIPHVGSWQNHCCQPRPMCSQHLATVFQYLNGRTAFVQKC